MLLDLEGLETLARRIAEGACRGFAVLLTGGLGSGKSTFARAFLGRLGVEGAIPSPSFIVDAQYDAGGMEIHHMDLYRLSGDPGELEAYGVLDALASGSVTIVEWAEKLPPGAASRGVRVRIGFVDDPGLREVEVDEFDLAGD